MSSAAELLRGLDAKATGAPWSVGRVSQRGEALLQTEAPDNFACRSVQMYAPDARCAATTRNLLPLLAGLVGALGDFMDPGKEDDVDANYQRVERAYDALNAAAAKEVK